MKKNTHQKVWKILNSDMGIKKDLSRGIINVRALAHYVINKYDLKSSIDSVISSIRRFTEDNPHIKREIKILDVFKNSSIKTKNNCICLTLKKEAPILDWFNKLKSKGSGMRVITGEAVTKIFLHNSLIDLANSHFKNSDIISRVENLSEISLILVEKAVKTKGVLSKISSELAMNEINIEEIIVCPPEFVIYIDSNDLLKSHEILFNLGI